MIRRQEGRVFNNLRREKNTSSIITQYNRRVVFVEWNFFPFFFLSPFSLRSMKRSTHSVLHMLLLLLRPLLLPSELWRAYNPGVEAAAAAGWERIVDDIKALLV